MSSSSLCLGGGRAERCNTLTRLYKMTFHFDPPRATKHRSTGDGSTPVMPASVWANKTAGCTKDRGGVRWIGVLGAASGVGASASPLSGADVTSALPQGRHTPVSLCGGDISALTFITVRFSGECARSFGGEQPSDWMAAAPGRGRRATAVTSSMI